MPVNSQKMFQHPKISLDKISHFSNYTNKGCEFLSFSSSKYTLYTV